MAGLPGISTGDIGGSTLSSGSTVGPVSTTSGAKVFNNPGSVTTPTAGFSMTMLGAVCGIALVVGLILWTILKRKG